MFRRLSLLALCILSSTSIAFADPIPTLLAKRGKLIFDDDGSIERGGRKSVSIGSVKLRAWAGSWKKNEQNGAWRSSWKPNSGHTPVAAYDIGKGKQNLIVEVTFRYGVQTEPWHTRCFRITLDNRERLVGHILSAWANPNNDFIETGFLLQHIHKNADKSIVKDLLLDRQSLQVKPEVWQTAILEVVGDEALFRLGEHVAYAKFNELRGDKTKVALTLGKTWHEVKRVRVWHAKRIDSWPTLRKQILSKRKPFEPQTHNYQKPTQGNGK